METACVTTPSPALTHGPPQTKSCLFLFLSVSRNTAIFSTLPLPYPQSLKRGVMAAMTARQGGALLASGRNSDFTITCRDKSWKVHKAIVGTISDHFAQLCDGNFKESDENRVDLSSDNPDVVEAVLSWMYTGEFSVPFLLGREPAQTPRPAFSKQSVAVEVKFLLDTYFFADRFFIDILKEIVVARIAAPFRILMANKWGAGQFLDLVFESSQSEDLLRSRLVVLAAQEFQVACQDRVLLDTMKQHELVALELCWELCLGGMGEKMALNGARGRDGVDEEDFRNMG